MPDEAMNNDVRQGPIGVMNGDNGCKEYREPKSELLKRWSITISFHDIGCTVVIGCKTIAFTDVADAMSAIQHYISDPYKVTKNWMKLFENNNKE